VRGALGTDTRIAQRDHCWCGAQHREADGLSSEGVVAVSETYQVAASREGRWWLLDCGEHGATQALSLSSAVDEARDLIALVLNVDPEGVDVELTVHVSDALDLMIAQAREVAERAGSEQREAAARSRAVVRALLDQGVTGADAARILKVSPQRISQLAKRVQQEGYTQIATEMDPATQRAVARRRRPSWAED